MFGDGIVSFGVADVTNDCRYLKSSSKIVWSSPILLPTCSAAGVNSIVPDELRNFTARFPGALLIPPSW